MKKFLSLILIVAFAVVLSSCTGVSESLKWEINDGVLAINGDSSIGEFCAGFDMNEPDILSAQGSVETPWQNESFHTLILGSDITYVSEHSFGGSTELEKVVLEGDGVRIGHCAFYGCEKLEEIENFDKVNFIDNAAFYECKSLTSLNFGDKLTVINRDAFTNCTELKEVYFSAGCMPKMDVDPDLNYYYSVFEGCSSLEKFEVEEGNTMYASYDGALLSADMSALYRYPEGKSDSTFTVPSEVTKITAMAFSGNDSIKTLVFTGKAMPSIGDFAFKGCTSLETIVIPSDVTGFSPADFEGFTVVRK